MPSSKLSAAPMIEVSGVRSSWETFETNSDFRSESSFSFCAAWCSRSYASACSSATPSSAAICDSTSISAARERIAPAAAEIEGADHLVADDQRQHDLAPDRRHAERVLLDAGERHVEDRGLAVLEHVGESRGGKRDLLAFAHRLRLAGDREYGRRLRIGDAGDRGLVEVHQPPGAIDDGLEDPLEVEARVDGVGDGVDQREPLVRLTQRVRAFRDLALEVAGQLFELANLVAQLHAHAVDLVTERAELVGARDVTASS